MTFDFHGDWENFVGHNSPLYSRADENETQAKLNINFKLQYWLDSGAPPEKIMLGLPLFGHSFSLKNESQFLPGSGTATPAAGAPGNYTNKPGLLSYYEICESIEEKNMTVVRDKESYVPYAYEGMNWISYDDVESIALKTLFAKMIDLGGIMFWVGTC